jgi:DNA-directed RNA polymerase specialized sigma24 family protein
MNQYETNDLTPHFKKFKNLDNSIHLNKQMLDEFLKPSIIKMYELNLRARRQSKKLFSITDSDIKMIITETYLNIIKQINRGKKPVIANKIKEFFGMTTYNQMLHEVKQKVKWSVEYVDMGDIDFEDESDESIQNKAWLQEANHNLYLKVMEIAQDILTKVELDCFVFKYYSCYTNKEIKQLLNISNLNKVTQILNQAEEKLKEATKSIKDEIKKV